MTQKFPNQIPIFRTLSFSMAIYLKEKREVFNLPLLYSDELSSLAFSINWESKTWYVIFNRLGCVFVILTLFEDPFIWLYLITMLFLSTALEYCKPTLLLKGMNSFILTKLSIENSFFIASQVLSWIIYPVLYVEDYDDFFYSMFASYLVVILVAILLYSLFLSIYYVNLGIYLFLSSCSTRINVHSKGRT